MDDLRERVEAVERALTDGDGELVALAEGAATADRVDDLAADVAAIREDLAEVSAATQALRGYVGNVRSVNEAVEERADAALAAVESLEDRVVELESPDPDAPKSTRLPRPRATSDQPDHACAACGRPTEPAPAADGGREGTRTDVGALANQEGDSTGAGPVNRAEEPVSRDTGSPPPGRDALDGFDPEDGGRRVAVRERPTRASESEPSARGATGETDEPTLVDRMRELL